jgi:7-cyano-7-deazaguanine synthase
VTDVLLYGGGIDSTTLLVHQRKLGREMLALHVDYGQAAATLEWRAVNRFCKLYDVEARRVGITLPFRGTGALMTGTPSTDPAKNIVHARNVMLVGLAAMLVGATGGGNVLLGYHEEPPDAPFPDATEAARAALNAAVATSTGWKVRVEAPFASKTRLEIARIAYALDPSILADAHTCYADVVGGCGACSHCVTRAEMLEHIGAT